MEKQGIVEKITEKATYWVGTPISVIVHTFFFVLCFLVGIFGIGFSTILLLLTTIVSLEAIYLSLFIQMTVNRHSRKLHDVHADITELQNTSG